VGRVSGVSRVVRITITTITENNSSVTTPRTIPTLANIKPTSPRGTIPKPTVSFFVPPQVPSPATTFPRKAKTVTARATPRTFGSKRTSSLTWRPVITKKSGMKR